MSIRFNLWRLPPVLVVHLKRFQFDSTSRRKLTNKVDFPLNGLDLKRYLASTRWDHLDPNKNKNNDKNDTDHKNNNNNNDNNEKSTSNNNDSNDNSSNNNTDNNNNKNSDSGNISMTINGTDGFMYDLYSVIHHIGALGGGHYVTTTRDRERTPMTEKARKMARQLSQSNLPSVSHTVNPTSIEEQERMLRESGHSQEMKQNIENDNENQTDNENENNVENEDENNQIKLENHVDNNVENRSENLYKKSENNLNNSPRKNIDNNIEKNVSKNVERNMKKDPKNPVPAPPPGGQWWCYNDDVVTEVQDPREVSSASAYVLFYMRRDVWGMSVSEIFDECRRTSMGEMVDTQCNTGTVTGTTSRMHEYTGSTDSTGAGGKRGFWRSRGNENNGKLNFRNNTHVSAHSSPSSTNERTNSVRSVSIHDDNNTSNSNNLNQNKTIYSNSNSSSLPPTSSLHDKLARTLAPVQNQNRPNTVPTLHSRLNARTLDRTLDRNSQNFSGTAGDDESSDDVTTSSHSDNNSSYRNNYSGNNNVRNKNNTNSNYSNNGNNNSSNNSNNNNNTPMENRFKQRREDANSSGSNDADKCNLS